jgi:transcriptional regulator with XRE-family HTH domain
MFLVDNQILIWHYKGEGGEKMKDRLRELREALNLSRVAFGERIGVSGDVINNLERGRVDMKELAVNLIVKTYNVSPEWLRSGIGEMFRPQSDTLETLAEEYDLSETDRILVERFLKMSKAQRDAVTAYIKDVAEALAERKNEEEMTTEAAEAAYREALGIAPPTESTASNTTADTKRNAGEAG